MNKTTEINNSYRFDVMFNNETSSNSRGWSESYEYCLDYIKQYNGTDESYFEDYKGGIVSIYDINDEVDVYEEAIK